MSAPKKIGVALGLVAVAAATFLALEYGFRDKEPLPEAKPPEAAKHYPQILEPKPPEQPMDTAAQPAASPVNPPAPRAEPQPEPPPLAALKPQPRPATDAGTEPPLQAVLTVHDTTPPPLEILEPQDRSYVMAPAVTIRAKSEAGARVEADGQALSEKAVGMFAGRINLKRGMNQIKVEAKDPVGNTTAALLRVTFVDLDRIRGFKDRFLSLLKQLDEVRTAAAEADRRGEELIEKISNTEEAAILNRLNQELKEIRDARRTLQQETETAIQEIDSLLAKNP